MKKSLSVLALAFSLAPTAWAGTLENTVAAQQVQIALLQQQIAELSKAIAATNTAVGTAQTTANKAATAAKDAQTTADNAATAAKNAQDAANTAQKRANASVPCGGTVSLRTNNPGVPQNKGWLVLTDTVAVAGNIVPGWGFNIINCN